MCGRTSNQASIDEIEEQLQCQCSNSELYKPKYNVAPSNYQPALICDTKLNKSIKIMQWGFIPSWTNKNNNNDKKTIKAINARDDSLLGTKQLFRRVKQNQRCIVVATGYYEWKKEDNKKIPYYVSYKDGKLLKLAAVYDILKQADDTELYTYAIVTTKCSKSLSFLHPRMPVILNNDEDIMNWINPRLSFNKVSGLMKSTELNDNLQCYRVSLDVNKVENQSPDLIVEVKEDKIEKKPENKSITDFFAKKPKNDNNKKAKKEENIEIKQEIKDEKEVKEEIEEEKPKPKPIPKSKSIPKSNSKQVANNKKTVVKNNKSAGQKRKMANKNNNTKKVKTQ
ncbi:DUF159-domain-containing protein [Anaeromyces robustus]|uniref:DUF159-domain-containing protein n=1 Tax=Anaeromyces robustus TaxID=1754192 RepID=A0A1Y1XIJ2_9FUNG|nr:DUF159-domain-containing protein [Anaeromyces robustus]|eukprot:ORX85588.1 DUF159-domain-containing protein [Anaeromyces robustus]